MSASLVKLYRAYESAQRALQPIRLQLIAITALLVGVTVCLAHTTRRLFAPKPPPLPGRLVRSVDGDRNWRTNR